ncbi:MAG: hypothetical protein IKH25_01650 [Muribaculaceae bacterium]|nr:hypothetical protein [Muribaculaceae bacterium]
MDYIQYTQQDADKDGISFAVSQYSQKLCNGDEIIGKIIFEDKPLIISKDYLDSIDNKNAVEYFEDINRTKSLYLRKIEFNECQFMYTNLLKKFFDHLVKTDLPERTLIWCEPIVWDRRGYIKHLNVFKKPEFPLKNQNILIFSRMF